MSVVIGLNAKIFRGAAGAQAATEMKNVKDVTLNISSSEADITTRKAEGWRVYAATLKEASLEFEMNYDTDDTDYTALKNAYMAGTPLAFFVTDGEGNGLDADFVLTQFNITQPLENAMAVSVTARPYLDDRAPEWVDAT